MPLSDIGAVRRPTKPKADSTLHNMRKVDLIAYIRALENNHNAAVMFNENQARYIESLRLPVKSTWRYRKDVAVCERCGFERQLDTHFGAAIACPNCAARMQLPEDRECATCGRFREGDGCGAWVDNCMNDYDAYSNWIPRRRD